MGKFLGFIIILAGAALASIPFLKPEILPTSQNPQIYLFIGLVIAFCGAIYFLFTRPKPAYAYR